MSEWHVFTKDGNEFSGNHIILTSDGYVVLHRILRKKVVEERTGLSRLIKPSFWRNPTQVHHESYRVDDYVIPKSEVLRIERWDTSNK